jgi:hypothetical protein
MPTIRQSCGSALVSMRIRIWIQIHAFFSMLLHIRSKSREQNQCGSMRSRILIIQKNSKNYNFYMNNILTVRNWSKTIGT